MDKMQQRASQGVMFEVAQRAVMAVLPALLWTLFYVLIVSLLYLFHSPFRVHSDCRTDWYAQLMKVLQVWCTVVTVCFHVGPHLLSSLAVAGTTTRTTSATTAVTPVEATTDASVSNTISIVFLPVFCLLNMLFLYIHKKKRTWHLGVTYGGSLGVILLNSLLLSLFSTAHYGSCTAMTAQRRARGRLWLVNGAVDLLCPAPVTQHVFGAVMHLFCIDVIFLYVDYRYKAWRGFDPARGILWSELYDLRKDRDDLLAALTTRGDDADTSLIHRGVVDFRLLEPKPRRISCAPHTSEVGGGRHEVPSRVTHPTPISPVVVTLPAQTPASTAAMVLTRPSRTSVPALRTSSEVVGGDDDYPLQSPSTTSLPSPSPQLDFVPSATEMVLLQSMQHPLNRPGMVPWFSTFIAKTTWQHLARGALDFLTFDVRILIRTARPKIFYLHFSALPRRVHHRARSPDSLSSLSEESLEEQLASSSRSEADEGDARRDVHGLRAAHDDTAACDVWFDWTADIGDGFNSSYEIARLLASPALRVRCNNEGEVQRHRWRPRAGVRGQANVAYKTTAAVTTPRVESLAPPAGVDVRPDTIVESIETRQAASVHTRRGGLVDAAHHRRTHSDGSPSYAALGSESFGEGTTVLGGLWEAARLTETHGASAGLLARSQRSRIYDAAAGRGVSDVAMGESAPSPHQSAAGNWRNTGWQSRRAAASREGGPVGRTSRMKTSTRQGSSVKGPRWRQASDGRAHYLALPRGSFVVVGGDLAYPNPCDETYRRRLFGPYQDALRCSDTLRSLHRAHYSQIVQPDTDDTDVAHLHLIDAASVAAVAHALDPHRTLRATSMPTEAVLLRSVPLFFAIPGNHDWFDGLTTYCKYIIEKSWIGGWFMPQRSSFFVLQLPYNWFMLCGDTGATQDIDIGQRNYFLDVIQRYMDESSCVILCAHEPGWLYDAMEHRDGARQPELNCVADALGTRLRLRLCGDIHNYSRHIPSDPVSEAATLVVSGGGGAFLHGARGDRIISQGTDYKRAAAFPARNTYLTIASRLFGFRLINWKFDVIVGCLSFLVILSLLPQSFVEDTQLASGRPSDLLYAFFEMTLQFVDEIVSHGVLSVAAAVVFFVSFAAAGTSKGASLGWRCLYSAPWTLAIVLVCCGALAYLKCLLLYMAAKGMLLSAQTGGNWASPMERQVRAAADAVLRHTRRFLGPYNPLAQLIASAQHALYNSVAINLFGLVIRSLDPLETLAYLSRRVSSSRMGVQASKARRSELFFYYLHVLFFYWIIITPLVSFIIGSFLFVTAALFDFVYDATYSAFQIEDFKHFIRFKIDHRTRELHAYVIAERTVPKVWQLNKSHVVELAKAGPDLAGGAPCAGLPPHLQRHPSRWRPTEAVGGQRSGATLFEHFIVRPHRCRDSELAQHR